MKFTKEAANKFTPWYLGCCAAPFLPALIVKLGLSDSWDLSASSLFLGLSIIGITCFCLINIVLGPMLIPPLSGAKRFFAIVGFLAGGILPIAVALISFFYGNS